MYFLVVLTICFSAILNLSTAQKFGCPSEGIAYRPHYDCTSFIVCLNGKRAAETWF